MDVISFRVGYTSNSQKRTRPPLLHIDVRLGSAGGVVEVVFPRFKRQGVGAVEQSKILFIYSGIFVGDRKCKYNRSANNSIKRANNLRVEFFSSDFIRGITRTLDFSIRKQCSDSRLYITVGNNKSK